MSVVLKPVDTGLSIPLHRQIRSALREVCAAEAPGTRLPSAAEIAAQLGVNRLTVLKAVRHLVQLGILRSVSGKGVYTTGKTGDGSDTNDWIGADRYFEGIAEGPETEALTTEDSVEVIGRIVDESLDDQVISFSAGFPPRDLLPLDALRRCTGKVLSGPSAGVVLGYAPTAGAPSLLAEIQRLLEGRGLHLDDDDVLVVTEGAQQAISLCLERFFEHRGALAVECPGYMGVLAACRQRSVPIVPVAVDRGGLHPGSLARALRRPEVRGLYTVPTFQNPTGVSQHLMRRRRILALAEAHDAMILEDDTYADLRLGGVPPAPIKSLPGGERVIYIGSFSKSLAPGLRLGFFAAKGELGQKLLHLKETIDISTGMLSQAVAAEFIAQGGYRRHLASVKKEYRSRRAAMLSALERHLGARVRVHSPKGGLHLYVIFEQPVDMASLEQRCRDTGVLYAPGALFFSDGRRPSAIRLNFAAHPAAVIEEGIGRLAACIRQEMKR